jgi:hypothetical protein
MPNLVPSINVTVAVSNLGPESATPDTDFALKMESKKGNILDC